MFSKFTRPFLMFTFLFVVFAPLSMDFYNTLNIRGMQDIVFAGSQQGEVITFKAFSWQLDWPYPPLTFLLTLPSWLFFKFVAANEFFYQFLFKMPMYLATLAIAWIIFKKTKLVPTDYLFNPGILLLTVIWGSFDIVNSFILLLSVLTYKKRPALSFFLLAISIALRLYPIVLLPFYLVGLYKNVKTAKIISYTFIALGIPILSFFVGYIFGGEHLLTQIKSQQAHFGPFGIYPILVAVSTILPIFSLKLMTTICFLLLLSSLVVLFVFYKRSYYNFETVVVLALLTFFLLYPKVHAQYVMTLLPFAFLSKVARPLLPLWIPGTLFALIINGFGNIRGIGYWFYWLTNISLPTSFVTIAILTVILASYQEVAIIRTIQKMLRLGKINRNEV